VELTLASPKGGQPPLDPKSDLPENQTETTKRFRADAAAQAQLANTKKLADVSADDFGALFYPGGHGPMWDMPDNATSIALIEAFVKADKPVGAVCHAPVAFVDVRGKDGEYLVKGKRVTGFTNTEEVAVGLDHVVPFLRFSHACKRCIAHRSGTSYRSCLRFPFEQDALTFDAPPVARQRTIVSHHTMAGYRYRQRVRCTGLCHGPNRIR
jgi:putative intracellular protease/amidase